MAAHPITVDPDLQATLERMAVRETRSPEFVLRDAVQMYASARGETDEAFVAIMELDALWDNYDGPVLTHDEFLSEGEAALNHMHETGLHLTGDEVSDWIRRLHTDPDAKLPECHT